MCVVFWGSDLSPIPLPELFAETFLLLPQSSLPRNTNNETDLYKSLQHSAKKHKLKLFFFFFFLIGFKKKNNTEISTEA